MDNNLRQFNRFMRGAFSAHAEMDFSEKGRVRDDLIFYMLDRTQSMFKWEGLPDSIPARILELYLQINGNCAFYEHNNTLYIFTGGAGGEPDVYYRPTIYTIANPALNLSLNLKINDDCIVMPNDSLFMGMIPMYRRYASLMAENELSISVALVNSRIVSLLSASDDRTRASAEKYISDIKDGKLGVIAEVAFLNGIKAQPFAQSANTNALTNLIEMEQYIKASWYNDIGLNANYNMKRESINSGESQLNNDALLPLVDDMLNCRKEAIEKVNAKYGTNISVSYASSWEDNEQEIEIEHGEGGKSNEPVEVE